VHHVETPMHRAPQPSSQMGRDVAEKTARHGRFDAKTTGMALASIT